MNTLIGEAIILEVLSHREAGIRALLSTNNYGHIYVVAPNAKKSKRRYIGGLNIFSRVEYSIEMKNEMLVLNESTLIDEYESAFSSIEAIITASILCEVSSKLYSINNPDESAFMLLKHSLMHIEDRLDRGIIYSFIRESMIRVGEFPEFVNCAVCQNKIDRKSLLFNYYKGGVLCKVCAKTDLRGEHISQRLYDFFLSDEFERASQNENVHRQAIFLLERYLRFKLNIVFKGFRFI